MELAFKNFEGSRETKLKAMKEALQNYERATPDFRAAWEVERDKFAQERRDLEKDRTLLELEVQRLESDRAAFACKERNLEEYRARLEDDRRAFEEDLAAKTAGLEEDRVRLAKGHRALEEDRASFDAEIAGVERIVVPPGDRVKLNVGGKYFETTRNTLTAALDIAPESMLGAMFSGRHEGRLQPDGEGRVSIERNGSMFKYLLDFLRDYSQGDENAAFAIHALPEAQMVVMRRELDYYGLESAVFPPAFIDLAIFSSGPEMMEKRCFLGAVVLPENRGVLVVGGTSDGQLLASTELLNLETLTYSPGPSMESRRQLCATVVLEDGKVIVVGGCDGYRTGLLRSEVLYPATNTWSQGPNLDSTRVGCAALPLSNDRIFVIGGCNSNILSTTEILDLASMTSTPGPEMSFPRYYCSAVMLHDGRVLVIGGVNNTDRNLSTTEVLDLTSVTSSPGPEMNEARSGTSAVLLPEDGGVLVMGGKGNDTRDLASTRLASTEVLDVAGNTTSAGPKLDTPRSFSAAITLPDDRILVIGGNNGSNAVSTSEILGMPTEVGQE